jgi:hypothetical protein
MNKTGGKPLIAEKSRAKGRRVILHEEIWVVMM